MVDAGLSEFLEERRAGIAADKALQLAERNMNRTREDIRGGLDRGTLLWKLTSASSPLFALFFSTSAAIIVAVVVVVPAV